ncbi:unnamed protein product [Cylindrotheca closterium]|uniref:RING-type E3 ubiquitin transferase n=1 Tax=Cylindrotheca closterium TaxID=2856 RepID=A0AAD2FJE5_9STRA|nr:unnamed protein product [Cylindrotheca closterium]
MMARAQIHTESSNDMQSTHSQTARAETLNSTLQNLVVVVQNSISSLRQSLDQSEGPHSLENQQEAVGSRLSIVTWILRLHMAHYCVTGTYPTIIHRLLKLNHAVDGSTEISYQPDTNRVVALLVGVQAAASMSRYIINFSADAFAEMLESRRFKSSTRAPPPSLEKSVFKKSSLRFDSRSHSKSTCGICRLDRKHAAASIHCGHVFCWNCLNQWISTVQQACPLCRRPCRTQDIIFLHNYQE